MIRRLAVAFAALALAATALVGTAAPANAAWCRWTNWQLYDSGGRLIQMAVSSCDYGSYERINYVKFYWVEGGVAGGTAINSLYTGTGDAGVRLKEGSSGGWDVKIDKARWYNNINHNYNELICHETCFIIVDLHVEVPLAPDRTLNASRGF
jgi:hypothetical protein